MFSIGLYGQHSSKKPKIKHPLDNTYDSITPMPGSIPSPVASQMSNMSNTSKFIKLIGGRDRGRKTKSLKVLFGDTLFDSVLALDLPFNAVLLYPVLMSNSVNLHLIILQMSAGQPGSGGPWSLFEDQVNTSLLSFSNCSFFNFRKIVLSSGIDLAINSQNLLVSFYLRHLSFLYMIWAQIGNSSVML